MIDKLCEECGESFNTEQRTMTLLGKDHDMTDRVCAGCCAKFAAEDKTQRQVNLEMARAGVRRKWREEWSGIPAKYMGADFATFEPGLQDTAKKLMEAYANAWDDYPKGKPSIFIYSEDPTYGVGKTHLMAAVCHRILDRWKGDPEHSSIPIRFVAERDLFANLRATYNQGAQVTEEQVYRRYKGAPLLLLDDLGKEKVRDPSFVQRVYWNVIDHRYQADMPVIISSNLSLDGVAARLGQATAERILEMTQGNLIEMTGTSYRLREVA
jgi:DNA replication protein DnaC